MSNIDVPSETECIRLVGSIYVRESVYPAHWHDVAVEVVTADAYREVVSLLRNARLILSDHGQEDGDNCAECREMVAEIDAHLKER
jgi:hypothetical protein